MTYDNIRRQYAANATQLEGLAAKAEQTGRTVNGQTADFWREKARIYRTLSTADDALIAEHLRSAQQSVSERLTQLRQPETGVPSYAVRSQLREATLKVGRES